MKRRRTTKGLRDILFDEIEELNSDKANPQKSQAVATLAKQILNTARIELEFAREMRAQDEAGNALEIGEMVLGSTTADVVSVAKPATER